MKISQKLATVAVVLAAALAATLVAASPANAAGCEQTTQLTVASQSFSTTYPVINPLTYRGSLQVQARFDSVTGQTCSVRSVATLVVPSSGVTVQLRARIALEDGPSSEISISVGPGQSKLVASGWVAINRGVANANLTFPRGPRAFNLSFYV